MLKKAILFGVLALPQLAHATDSWSDAYSRRSYKLGMTLSEFRSTPYPDTKDWPSAYSVCSDEPRAASYPYQSDLSVSKDWRDAGVVSCMFFFESGSAKMVYSAGVILGDIPSHTKFHFIRQKPEDEPRLFYITSSGPTANYDDLVATFTQALGKPSSVKSGDVQNRLGASFKNDITTWSNTSSKVVISRYGDTIRLLQVEHILTPLWKSLESGLSSGRADKAKNL
ncbi:hypothetical protein [Xanthomonas campestris]|uniref:hypothetical protein n=1 Tax=Xanthomonas campestris TaxID=339 RepID=UPI00137B0D6D|nr:hypothetical protein [Xanthomonas campestris]